MKRLPFALLLCLVLSAACAPRTPYAPVQDLVSFPQDAGKYHGLQKDALLLAPDAQQKSYAAFLTEHFGPWNRTQPKHTAKEAFWALDSYGSKQLFGENMQPRDPAWMETMAEDSRVDHYPSMSRMAISVVNTSMRSLPTAEPAFYDFAKAGEGFPFDYMQNSLVLAGTPLYATHLSADRAWVLVESRFTYGWVPVTDIAWVDSGFKNIFMTGTYAAITRDNVPIHDADGNYRFTGHVGSLLPVLRGGIGANGYAFIIPVRGPRGYAVPFVAFLPDPFAALTPVPATPDNFSTIANTMMGRPYGWGGLYENRDCSAMIMDLMVPFGIYLPRNSSQQIKVGAYTSLEDLDRNAKLTAIVRHGTPFLTMIRKPGHIMLYIGQTDGKPMIMHAVWGVKTKSIGKYGRKVIGKTAVTTLEAGKELPNLAPGSLLIESVYGMSTLPGAE